MYKRKKTQQEIKRLEEQIQTLRNAISTEDTTSKTRSKREFFISIIGVVIAVIGAFIAWKQIEISENQNKLVNSQVEISKQQAEFQELDIYKSFLDLDQNDRDEVNKFIDYIDLLDSKTADKLLNKFSNLEVSNLSIAALNTYYTRLHEHNENGLSGKELANFVVKLNVKATNSNYCVSCFEDNFKETVQSIIKFKEQLSFEEYRTYITDIKNNLPTVLVEKLIKLEVEQENARSKPLSSYRVSRDRVFFYKDYDFLYLKIIILPQSLYELVDDYKSRPPVLSEYAENLSEILEKLVKSSDQLKQLSTYNRVEQFDDLTIFFNSLDLYFETFIVSRSVDHLKHHLKISAEIIKENQGWDCTPIETVDYLQFWLLDSFE